MTKKLLIVVILLGLVLTGCNNQTIKEDQEGSIQTEKIKTLSYENKQYRLKLDFDSNRTFKENVYGATVMFFAPEKEGKTTKENLGITIKLINSGANLDSLYSENKDILQGISENFNIESEKDIKIDNYPAKQIQYNFSQGDYNIKQEQTLVIKEETLYMINYTATQETFDEYKNDVDKIIKSISIR